MTAHRTSITSPASPRPRLPRALHRSRQSSQQPRPVRRPAETL